MFETASGCRSISANLPIDLVEEVGLAQPVDLDAEVELVDDVLGRLARSPPM